jgi:partner of Y14 and mago protein
MPPKAAAQDKTSNAGILTTATGETVIPSSVRADGSVRKEIRVRAGYRPPEDVEVYKNRTAEAWKNRGSGGVPGAEVLEDDNNESKTSSKNSKRREARKRAKEATKSETETAGDGQQNEEESQIAEDLGSPLVDTVISIEKNSNDNNIENEKLARNLRKKLRQAKDLEARKDGGESLLPEQLEKVIKINELVRQLSALGLEGDEDATKKT